MNNRRNRDRTTHFKKDGNAPHDSILKADAQTYGFTGIDGGFEGIEPISIFSIRPDPTQPRRAIPSSVRALWNGEVTPDAMNRLLKDWEALAQQERGDHPLYTQQRLSGQEISEELENGSLASSFLELIDLATSIQNVGLTNPITVVRQNNAYQLETGERRWLAYHLLYAYSSGDDAWADIPARIVAAFDRFRQATENILRGDLNMVARARQWALLVMTQHERQNGTQFASYDQSEDDHSFYAQVIARKLTALNNAELMTACGVSSSSALGVYRTVLKLDGDEWIKADDESWSYAQIERLLKRRSNALEHPSTKREKTRPAAQHISQLKKWQMDYQKKPERYSSHEREELKRVLLEWLNALK
jgi:hypothetical protein